MSRLQKIPTTTIRSKMQAEQSILDRIYQWTPHGRRRRERPQQSWKNQMMVFTRSGNMEENTADDRHLWRSGVDERFLAV